jgi:putative tryptophan/tyrosine transport system substrate-binding protein
VIGRSLLVVGLLLCAGVAGSAFTQESQRVSVIGRLASGGVGPGDPVNDVIRTGLKELGYVEGRDFKLVVRNAAGHSDQLPRLAEELVRLKVDVIVTGTEAAARAAQQATKTIPIVAVLPEHDPVASGLIASFNRPGGNLTGLTVRNSQLAAKRLQLLKEMLPGLVRVAVVWDVWVRPEVEQLQQGARSLGIELYLVEVKDPYNFDAALAEAKKHMAGAVMLLSSPAVYMRRTQLGQLTLEHRLPCDAVFHDITRAGGLMSYSTGINEGFHRSVYYIDRVLKGTKPADLPFEQSANVKLVINLRTAKVLGITVPESILLRADEVVR